MLSPLLLSVSPEQNEQLHLRHDEIKYRPPRIKHPTPFGEKQGGGGRRGVGRDEKKGGGEKRKSAERPRRRGERNKRLEGAFLYVRVRARSESTNGTAALRGIEIDGCGQRGAAGGRKTKTD
jgi:hypothetical protein